MEHVASADVGARPRPGDAFGQALLDTVAGRASAVVIERDDGFVNADAFDYLDAWPERDLWALGRAAGRVLDVGAGAGRAALALQERGQEVVALDVSPGAIQACRGRGIREVFAGSVQQAVAAGMAGRFDSALMLGNNLSLLGSPAAAGSFLAALGALLRPGGLIVGTCLDPGDTSEADHLAYHERNRRAGRPAGQLTLRVRYRQLAGPWFDWLLMSPDELGEIAAAAGWQVAELRPGAQFAAVLTKPC
jgi:SAM-dependent methyltransferase